ncbi:uncharacterized protein LOC128450381 [Pleuronectes platessa]|uniref:uncharacterized protein LOC128450381 n=1 Tax=Pleuronectes platessa TaxID=8262 RepID=UPI00232A0DEF|nr:uncharacterized protein LOC128450381 [Pleuronectes platessa]
MSAVGEEIRQAVLLVLPSLQEDKLQSLLNNLELIGEESRGDLQFIKEEDLPADITRIQCRRLLNAWQTEDEKTCVTLTTVDPSDIYFSTTTDNPSSSQSTSSHSSHLSGNTFIVTVNLSAWPENFNVPWNRMSPGIKTAIAQEKGKSAKDHREMVRIIVDEMRLTELNPSKSQCLTVAKMIVKQHPRSFADGTVIGSGYGSLLTQLKTRVEHVNRGNVLIRRREPKILSNPPADIARGPADLYGCVRWQPDCPPGETVESLKEKQREMMDLYCVEGPAGAERGHLTQLMKTTYYLQRKNINAIPPPSITELKNDWPYLFSPKELYSHFKLLTDIDNDILDKMNQAMEEKGKLILQFFEQKPAGTNADEAVFGVSYAPFGLREPLSIGGDILLEVRKTLLHSMDRANHHSYASLHVIEFCPEPIKGAYLAVNRGDSGTE